MKSELFDFKELLKRTGLPERTLRYYLGKVVNAPGGTRGRKAFYSEDTLNRLLLVKKLLSYDYNHKRGEVKPSLTELRHWLSGLEPEPVRYMLRNCPVSEIAGELQNSSELTRPDTVSKWENQNRAATGEQIIRDEIVSYNINREETNTEKPDHCTDSAAEYLDRVLPARRHQYRENWQSHSFGDDLIIKTRGALSREQKELLRLAGKLLQALLKRP